MSDCPLCDQTRHEHALNVADYAIVRCVHCNFMFVSPPPSSEALREFYQNPAYYVGSSLGYNDYWAEKPLREREARWRLPRIERLAPAKGKVLDVGCAAGFFLKVAQERGWDPFGVELSTDMADSASTLIGRPVVGSLAELRAAPASFDAITFWEYIEHIPDPRAEVLRLVELLKPGGILALSTPNTNYWEAVHQPAAWREFKPPSHLGFFTAATLRQMLESCGLEVIAIPKVGARAPNHPYALQRLLALLRQTVGSGADRKTPFWWLFSLAFRLVEWAIQGLYKLRWPASDMQIGLEAYARKR